MLSQNLCANTASTDNTMSIFDDLHTSNSLGRSSATATTTRILQPLSRRQSRTRFDIFKRRRTHTSRGISQELAIGTERRGTRTFCLRQHGLSFGARLVRQQCECADSNVQCGDLRASVRTRSTTRWPLCQANSSWTMTLSALPAAAGTCPYSLNNVRECT